MARVSLTVLLSDQACAEVSDPMMARSGTRRKRAEMDVELLMRTGAVVLVLALTAVALLRWRGVTLGWAPLIALVRAAVQLAAIALLLRGVVAWPWMILLFIALMLATASLTAVGRLRQLQNGPLAAVTGVVASGLVVPAILLLSGIVSTQPTQIIAIVGILIGNSMSASTLAGRRFGAAAQARSGEIEGWWALGARSAVAHDQIVRDAVREALVPNLDSTRTTGLVTLPGAFVGALFGGASPIEAGRFQLVVLGGIVFAQTLTALIVTAILARSTQLPATPDR